MEGAYLAWVEGVHQPEPGVTESGFAVLDLLHPSEMSLIRAGSLNFRSLVEREIDDGLKTLPLILPLDQMTPQWREVIHRAEAERHKLYVWVRSDRRDGDSERAQEEEARDSGRAVLALLGWDQDEANVGNSVFIERIAVADFEDSDLAEKALNSANFLLLQPAALSPSAPKKVGRGRFLREILDQPTWMNPQLFAGVYDVGQGSASALVDSYEHPRIFFDIGKPISVFNHTRPANPPDFFHCDTTKITPKGNWFHAPVVLSHWDFDHWAGVLKSASVKTLPDGTKVAKLTLIPHALDRYWIAPNQERLNLGPTHRELIRLLAKSINGNSGMSALQYWPEKLTQVPFKHGVVIRATPDAGAESSVAAQRNNSGLVMLLTYPVNKHIPNNSAPWVLLPGDARWEAIPMNLGNGKLVGMVVSHHGGLLGNVPVASPWLGSKSPNPNVVCSVGRPNAVGKKPYGHPDLAALAKHVASNWDTVTLTSNLMPPASSTKSLGNYCVSLDNLQPLCGCSCVGTANLSLNRIFGT